MAGAVPLLGRLAQLAPVPAAEAADLVERLAMLQADPVVGPLFGVDEEGDLVVNPLVPTVLKSLQDRTDLTCYGALLEGLTGIWNAAVRAGVVARLRASGLPPDDLLLRLGALSPTLGVATDTPEWAREWLPGPLPPGGPPRPPGGGGHAPAPPPPAGGGGGGAATETPGGP